MSIVVTVLHLYDVSSTNEFVEQGISRLVADFVLDRNQDILQVHYSIL